MPRPATPPGREPFAVALAQLRRIITTEAPPLIDEYGVAHGLPHSNTHFQANVIQAILLSVALHWEAPKRNDLRKEMSRVEKKASRVAKELRSLQTALDVLTPLYRDAIYKRLEIPNSRSLNFTALHFDTLSALADMYAKVFKRAEKGGAPKMLEFQMLVEGLDRAFQDLTGHQAKVTWNPYLKKYEGRFVDLVEVMLPLALTCTERFGWKMSHPGSKRARGKYIYEMTRLGRPIPRTSYHIS
jgi:hypothetical protein